ncbi:MAG: DUF1491 family protein [Rhodospirillaceae bacterium]
MTAPRLKSKILVDSIRRRCDLAAVPALILRKGDPDAGGIALRLDDLKGGIVVYVQARTGEGAAAWMRGTGASPVAEDRADAYLEKQTRMDPDLWVLAIEDPTLVPPVDDPLL